MINIPRKRSTVDARKTGIFTLKERKPTVVVDGRIGGKAVTVCGLLDNVKAGWVCGARCFWCVILVAINDGHGIMPRYLFATIYRCQLPIKKKNV